MAWKTPESGIIYCCNFSLNNRSLLLFLLLGFGATLSSADAAEVYEKRESEVINLPAYLVERFSNRKDAEIKLEISLIEAA